jgi:hypothetical protein
MESSVAHGQRMRVSAGILYGLVVRRTLILGLIACHSPQTGNDGLANHAMVTDRTSMVISPVIATICIDAGATARADWPAARSKGALFVLADPEGYVATARIGHREQDCDDCAGPGIDAVIVDRGVPRKPGCFTAFGPVDRPLVHARAIRLGIGAAASYHAVSDWAAFERIDLGGDNYADLALVTRCAHVLPSGCIDHVCDQTCSGVRVGTALNATPTSIVCRSFIPDVDDCVP